MSTSPVLPISRLIDVTVELTPVAAQAQSLSTLLILGSSPVIDPVTRYRLYDSIEGVIADFGTSAPEYLAAVPWFAQSPQPVQLYIGRWVQAASSGQLYGATFSTAQQAALLTALQAITNGGIDFTIDGSAKNLTALNFSSAVSLPGVAAIIQTALAGGITCVWNAVYGRFIITSSTTGTSSSVSFATAGVGTDISSTLGLRQTNSGSYVVAGLAAETAISAVTLFDQNYGALWFGLYVCGAADADHELIAPYIEASGFYHYYGVGTSESGVLNSSSTTDIAYILAQGKYTRTMVQYNANSVYAVVSAMARIMTTDYTGNSTVITLMYKQEPTITPDNLTPTQAAVIEAKNANFFAAYNNNTAIIEPGQSCAGPPYYVDTVIGSFALALAVQTELFNLLYSTTTKIPQTDAGMHILVTGVEAVCSQFVANGLLAPGQWNAPGFGALNEFDQLAKGYYVYAPPVATQSAAARASRISVPIQVAAKLAGAIQTVNCSITVNS